MIFKRHKKWYRVEGYIVTMNGLPAMMAYYESETDYKGRIVYAKDCVMYHHTCYGVFRSAIKRQQRRYQRETGIKDPSDYRIIRITSRVAGPGNNSDACPTCQREWTRRPRIKQFPEVKS